MPLPNVEWATGKRLTDGWLPVVLVATADGYTAVTGVAAGTAATAYYATAGATAWVTYTIATADWQETGSGQYWLRIGESEWAATGRYAVRVVATDCRPVVVDVEVLERTAQQVVSDVVDVRQALVGVHVADDDANRRVIYDLDGVTPRITLEYAYGAPTLTVTPV